MTRNYYDILCDLCKTDITDDSYSLPDGRWVCFDCWNKEAP